ncbi:DUF4286 family protein [bacterium]|nr:DUF4286 family protein [bacterium]
MYIYNVTFVVEKQDGDAFLKWLRDEALAELMNPESPAREPRLTEVVNVPGAPDFGEHACSFALQTEFQTLEDAEKWAEVYLQPVVGKYAARFGMEKAHSFATILRNIDL